MADRLHPGARGGASGSPAETAETRWSPAPFAALVEIALLGGPPDSGTIGAWRLPPPGSLLWAGDLTLCWVGPRRWQALAERPTPGLVEQLAGEAGPHASVLDLTDSRLRLRLSGSDARQVLAAGSTVDFRPERFAAGAAALTRLGKIAVAIHARPEAETFDILVGRSFGHSLGLWLERVGATCREIPQ